MPKIVDHDARREEIIEAVWRLVARRGFAALNMRDLAAEAGFTNGALARYFPTKAAILRAALERANAATEQRAARTIAGANGLNAFRKFCVEIMPLDDERLNEARVVIGFWNYAVADQELIGVYDQAISRWRDQMLSYLHTAAEAGEINPSCDLDAFLDLAMATLMGLQINAIFAARLTTPSRQLRILDGLVAGLQTGTS
ncbi:TetR/AcrR family transcriptional regulator [Streptomyces sp. NPDC102259]|uniref:TetR/AcrR family transcriptional regulator n=1 Tax=Streptomyces sp. NPDC102259 TaxID=3366148 RepID=UPI0037FB002B